jgi:hypothetical protein
MSARLAGSKALWNRSSVDLRSDEQLAQLMDRGSLSDWAILREMALLDASSRGSNRDT